MLLSSHKFSVPQVCRSGQIQTTPFFRWKNNIFNLDEKVYAKFIRDPESITAPSQNRCHVHRSSGTFGTTVSEISLEVTEVELHRLGERSEIKPSAID